MTTPAVPPQPRMNGADMLNKVETAFRTYTVQPNEHAYVALTVYTVYTHFWTHFDFAPRLVLNSAEKRCGKTRTLEILTALTHNPLPTVNASTSAIFREIPASHPVLILDEADTVFGTKIKAEQNEDLRGLLNAGFQRGAPVLRCVGVGTKQTTQAFQTFAPAVIAGIGTLPDTITDRAVNIRLRRRKASEHVSQYRLSRDGAKLHDLREQIASWVHTIDPERVQTEPDNPLTDRAADVWEPLLAVADVAGGQWPRRAREAALVLVREAEENDEESSTGIELLRDIRNVLNLHTGPFIHSDRLLELLRNLEDSPWVERDLTTRTLAQKLKPYGVKPQRDKQGQKRGYVIGALNDVFERYLPAQVSDTSEPVKPSSGDSDEFDAKPRFDTYKRQKKNKRQNVSPGQGTNLTHLTGLTHQPADSGDEQGNQPNVNHLDAKYKQVMNQS